VSRVQIGSTVCVFVCVCVFVYMCLCVSVIPPITMFHQSQSGFFSGNICGGHPVWNLFGLPATMMDVGHVFPQSVHVNIGVVFE
jgi:hypothetical protein